MERRNLILGFVVLGFVVLAIYFLFKTPNSKIQEITSLPSPSSEEKFEDKFNLNIPENVDKADLIAISSDASGIATRKFESGLFSIDVLTDLPDLEDSYQAWIVNEEKNDKIFLGGLSEAKGGYILNYDISRNLNDYKKVVITKNSPQVLKTENVVLQGYFD